MNASLRIARVNGAPVVIHWLLAPVLAWVIYVGWSQGGGLGSLYATGLLVATFGCILLHEIGHTVQAQAIGIPVQRISLLPLGGLAQLAHVPETPRDELRVAVAGPLVNLSLTLVCGALLALWLAGSGDPLPSGQRLFFEILRGQPGGLPFFASLTFVNAGLLALNALPAFPLDGGRVLRSALALRLPRGTATRIVARLGWGLGAICLFLAAYAGHQWGEPIAITFLLTGITAVLGAGAEESFERGQAALKGTTARAAVRQPTWCLQPTEALTPVLLAAIEALHRPALPVVEDARLVGLVTMRDLAAAGAQPSVVTVGSVMRIDFIHIDAEADLWRAQQMLQAAGQEALPVLDGEQLHGLLTNLDIRTALLAPPSPTRVEAPQFISPAQSGL